MDRCGRKESVPPQIPRRKILSRWAFGAAPSHSAGHRAAAAISRGASGSLRTEAKVIAAGSLKQQPTFVNIAR
jgi:hypothetical protein